MKQRDRSGFTLIELLIVVVIIGILAAIAIPKFSEVRTKGFISAMKSDLRNLASLQEIYYNTNYSFTNDLDAVGFRGTDGVTITVAEADNRGWSASTVHAGLPAESCALYHGNATPLAPATVPGVPTCTR